MHFKTLQLCMKKRGLDALVLFKPENVFYTTGFFSKEAISVLYTNEDPILFIPKLEAERAKAQANVNFEIFDNKPLNLLAKTLKNKRKIGIDEDYIPLSFYNKLKRKFRRRFKPSSDLIKETRMIKSDEEIKKISRAVRIAEEGILVGIKTIEAGKTELEVAAKAEFKVRSLGSEFVPYETIVASGINAVYPHTKATNKQIKNGEFVIIDLGAQDEHNKSDLTRTVCVGKISSEQN